LQELARRGHTDIGIHGAELYDWGQRRSELIKKAAARFDPPMKITISGPAEKIWTRAARTGMDGLFVRLEKRAGLIKGKQTRAAQPDAVRRMVRREADSLLSLIERGCTALICLNDLFAHQYYLLFQLLCIRVPGDISLISFDNIPESINFPVSTIDFGFERLGYLAAHIFIGDISIRADRDGAIPGVCTLVDRGSIGQVQCRPRTRA
jgi:DNA-binding LacI/PurR family transcriptional regulator